MQREIETFEFAQSVNFEFIDSPKKTTVESTCFSLTILVIRFAIQKFLLILPVLEDIAD